MNSKTFRYPREALIYACSHHNSKGLLVVLSLQSTLAVLLSLDDQLYELKKIQQRYPVSACCLYTHETEVRLYCGHVNGSISIKVLRGEGKKMNVEQSRQVLECQGNNIHNGIAFISYDQAKKSIITINFRKSYQIHSALPDDRSLFPPKRLPFALDCSANRRCYLGKNKELLGILCLSQGLPVVVTTQNYRCLSILNPDFEPSQQQKNFKDFMLEKEIIYTAVACCQSKWSQLIVGTIKSQVMIFKVNEEKESEVRLVRCVTPFERIRFEYPIYWIDSRQDQIIMVAANHIIRFCSNDQIPKLRLNHRKSQKMQGQFFYRMGVIAKSQNELLMCKTMEPLRKGFVQDRFIGTEFKLVVIKQSS